MKQRTIAKSITVTGIGLHSGKEVTLTFKPNLPDSGIQFLRSDVANAPLIDADAFLVTDTLMSSNLEKQGIKIGTVEHLLSAVAGLGIDNLLIQVSAAEVPIMDGSATVYTDTLLAAGMVEQEAFKKFLRLRQEVTVKQEDKWASLTPDNGFFLTFDIEFDHPAIPKDTWHYNFEFSSQNFIDHIARARTFGFMRDIEYLQSQNLALGGSLDNAIVLDDEAILNEEGLRYQDEFVRHKILDAIGDLYLARYPIIGRFTAHKSGHALNNALVRKMYSDKSNFEIVTFYDNESVPISYVLPNSTQFG